MGFAEFALAQRPRLARRLQRPDAVAWLDAQASVEVNGERRWIVGGDQLVDEAEAKLRFARDHGLVEDADLRALQAQFGDGDRNPDTETAAIDPQF